MAIENHKYRKHDIMDIMAVLDEVTVRDGYVIHSFMAGDRIGSNMQLYAYVKGSTRVYVTPKNDRLCVNIINPDKKVQQPEPVPYSDDMIIEGAVTMDIAEQIAPVNDSLSVPFNEQGVWQMYLINHAPTMMPYWWHGGYIHRTYVFDLKELSSFPADLSAYYGDTSLLPSVRADGDVFIVTTTYWNEWRGLVREVVAINSDLQIREINKEVLVEYDCGLLF